MTIHINFLGIPILHERGSKVEEIFIKSLNFFSKNSEKVSQRSGRKNSKLDQRVLNRGV